MTFSSEWVRAVHEVTRVQEKTSAGVLRLGSLGVAGAALGPQAGQSIVASGEGPSTWKAPH